MAQSTDEHLTRAQAEKVLSDLREFHRNENWMKPNAASWDESHVQETTGKTLAEFENDLHAEGYASFEEFFIASLMSPDAVR